MDRRDEELLSRQLRNMSPVPSDRVFGPAMLAVFVVGFLLGGLLFTRSGDAPQTQDMMASIAIPPSPSAIVRR